MLPLAWLAAGGLVGALLMQRFGMPPPSEPPRTRPLTFSGQDRDPAASPDGRLVAFASTRDGVSRIWIKQLQGGGEAPLTAGPDRYAALLARRLERALHSHGGRVTRSRLPHRARRRRAAQLVEDAYQADWLPDGTSHRLPAPRHSAAGRGRRPDAASGRSGLRELASGREQDALLARGQRALSGMRVSPDGRTLGVIEGPVDPQHALRAGR